MSSASHLVVVPTGSSQQYRSQDNLGQYAFGYDESGATGGTFRHEKSDAAGNRIGSYGLRGADGRIRIVNYVADANGYRASVQTNEPGTESRDTGSVAMNRPVTLALEAAPIPDAGPVQEYAQEPVPVVAPVAVAGAPAPVPIVAAPEYALPAPGPIYAPLAQPQLPQLLVPGSVGYGFTVVSQHPAAY